MVSLSEVSPRIITTDRRWSSKLDTDAGPVVITIAAIGMTATIVTTIKPVVMDATTAVDTPAIGVAGNTEPSANGFPDIGPTPVIDAVTGDEFGTVATMCGRRSAFGFHLVRIMVVPDGIAVSAPLRLPMLDRQPDPRILHSLNSSPLLTHEL